MKPTPPSVRSIERPDRYDRFESFEYETMLDRELRKRTDLKNPPSEHIAAWRDFERAFYFARGAHRGDKTLGYNIWEDAARQTRSAQLMLTSESFRKTTGFTTRTTPRRALALVAHAVGYRYMRGLDSVTNELTLRQTSKFLQERRTFLAEFELSADAAHSINDRGQNLQAALEVVQMFADELIALCAWLEMSNQGHGATVLREKLLAAS